MLWASCELNWDKGSRRPGPYHPGLRAHCAKFSLRVEVVSDVTVGEYWSGCYYDVVTSRSGAPKNGGEGEVLVQGGEASVRCWGRAAGFGFLCEQEDPESTSIDAPAPSLGEDSKDAKFGQVGGCDSNFDHPLVLVGIDVERPNLTHCDGCDVLHNQGIVDFVWGCGGEAID